VCVVCCVLLCCCWLQLVGDRTAGRTSVSAIPSFPACATESIALAPHEKKFLRALLQIVVVALSVSSASIVLVLC